MTGLNTIMFDLDGTLTDSGEGITKSARYALSKLGINEDDEARLRRFIGPPLKESFHDFYAVDESMLDQAVLWYQGTLHSKGNVRKPAVSGSHSHAGFPQRPWKTAVYRHGQTTAHGG